MFDAKIHTELLHLVLAKSPDVWLSETLRIIQTFLRADDVALWRAVRGEWRCVASTSERAVADPSGHRVELLAHTADDGQPHVENGMHGIPMRFSRSGEELPYRDMVLVVDIADPEPIDADSRETLELWIELLHLIRIRSERLGQQDSILAQVTKWFAHDKLRVRLNRIAGATSELLAAEGAMVWIWDRRQKQFLGFDGTDRKGPIRVDEELGVVGRAFQSGNVEIAEAGDPLLSQIEYEQQGGSVVNAIALGLISDRGKTIGVLEAWNRSGGFAAQHETILRSTCRLAVDAIANHDELDSLFDAAPQPIENAGQLLGTSPQIEKLRGMIGRVAPSDLPVLVLGENGTGKEVVSRSIHFESKRAEGPFVAVNCAALTKTLLESELFGHEKGSFTDANESRAGKFELATGGTLMLDEIGELPLDSQAKLLRVIEEQTVVRVGGSDSIKIDTRLVAATNRDLGEMVRSGEFREDLFFRLNVVQLELPPLRDRGDDILLLAEQFLTEFSSAAGRDAPKLTAAARKKLSSYGWPGNVRELRNIMERVAFLTSEEAVDAEDLSFSSDEEETRKGMTLRDATREFQIEYILAAIEAAGGNMTEAARRMGLHRSNLYRKMGQLGLETDE